MKNIAIVLMSTCLLMLSGCLPAKETVVEYRNMSNVRFTTRVSLNITDKPVIGTDYTAKLELTFEDAPDLVVVVEKVRNSNNSLSLEYKNDYIDVDHPNLKLLSYKVWGNGNLLKDVDLDPDITPTYGWLSTEKEYLAELTPGQSISWNQINP